MKPENIRPTRRGFLARLLGTGFGLAVGESVCVKPAKAGEVPPDDCFLLPPLSKGNVWLEQMLLLPSEHAIDVTSLRDGPRHDYRRLIPGFCTINLDVRFSGNGVVELARQIATQFGWPFPPGWSGEPVRMGK